MIRLCTCIALAFLTGCSTSSTVWEKAGVTPEQRALDELKCDKFASDMMESAKKKSKRIKDISGAQLLYFPSNDGEFEDNHHNRKLAREYCMKEKQYKKRKN